MLVKKILVLAVNPKDTGRLRLDEEVRQIREALKLSDEREQFEVISEWAVRSGTLHRHLLHHKPQIVHFSGHGAGETGLVMEDNNGQAQLVSTATLDRLFRLCSGVECVLMNACHSAAQINAIAKHVESVIGMKREVGDATAIRFAEGFYDGLGYGRAYKESFEFGLLAIEEEGLPDILKPVIKGKNELGTYDNETLQIESNLTIESRDIDFAKKRVFISYKRDARPDETIALELYKELSQRHEVFIDQVMPVGMRWARRIEDELQQTDALIVLLSESSVGSEMVQQEIALSHSIAEKNGGVPKILPVRLDYRRAFQYPLSVYLDPINWAIWDTNGDTAKLIVELDKAITGGGLSVISSDKKKEILIPVADSVGQVAKQSIPRPFPVAQPNLSQSFFRPLELPGGTMDLESAFYVERDSDPIALETVLRPGVTITIKGPRQMGKSSLLNRVMDKAVRAGKRVTFLDFQLFDRAALQDADEFYQQFCFWLTDELEIKNCLEEYWNKPLGHTQRCTRYVERHILRSLDAPLLLAMDEVERIFDTPFRNDFFSMLRSWHNQRATKKLWKRLDLALVTSTEPYQLIADLNQSPFNVGQVLALQDFTIAQVLILNQQHQNPLTVVQVQQLMKLVNGHPYLVRKSLYLVASNQWTATALLEQASEEKGPFGSHLRNHLFRLASDPELVEGLVRILHQQICTDERTYFRLHGAGLVCRERQRVFVRNHLYANYFDEYLKGS